MKSMTNHLINQPISRHNDNSAPLWQLQVLNQVMSMASILWRTNHVYMVNVMSVRGWVYIFYTSTLLFHVGLSMSLALGKTSGDSCLVTQCYLWLTNIKAEPNWRSIMGPINRSRIIYICNVKVCVRCLHLMWARSAQYKNNRIIKIYTSNLELEHNEPY